MKASLSLKFLSLQISIAAALPRPVPQGPEDAIAFTSGSLIYESIESTTTPVAIATSESVCTTPRTSTVTGTTTIYQTIEPASASSPAEAPSSSMLVAQATPSTNQISLKTTLTTSEVQTFTSATTMMSSNTGVSLFFPTSMQKLRGGWSDVWILRGSCLPSRQLPNLRSPKDHGCHPRVPGDSIRASM